MATDEPDGDRQRAAAALEKAERYAPLDLLVEIVEARHSERRRQSHRWYVGTGVALVTAYFAFVAVPFVLDSKDQLDTVVDSNRVNARLGSAERNSLDDFPSSPVEIGGDALDRRARAVLSAERFQGPLLPGTSIPQDGVFYVDAWRWVDVVFPDGNRDDPEASCGIMPPGTLTVRGFIEERNEALVEYRVQGETGGTRCETGTYFFVPVTAGINPGSEG